MLDINFEIKQSFSIMQCWNIYWLPIFEFMSKTEGLRRKIAISAFFENKLAILAMISLRKSNKDLQLVIFQSKNAASAVWKDSKLSDKFLWEKGPSFLQNRPSIFDEKSSHQKSNHLFFSEASDDWIVVILKRGRSRFLINIFWKKSRKISILDHLPKNEVDLI